MLRTKSEWKLRKEDAELGVKTMLNPPQQPKTQTTTPVTMNLDFYLLEAQPNPAQKLGIQQHCRNKIFSSLNTLSYSRITEKPNGAQWEQFFSAQLTPRATNLSVLLTWQQQSLLALALKVTNLAFKIGDEGSHSTTVPWNWCAYTPGHVSFTSCYKNSVLGL